MVCTSTKSKLTDIFLNRKDNIAKIKIVRDLNNLFFILKKFIVLKLLIINFYKISIYQITIKLFINFKIINLCSQIIFVPLQKIKYSFRFLNFNFFEF